MLFQHPVMDEAANVRHAFGISLIVGGTVAAILLLAYIVYAMYYERKHWSYQKSKTTQDLPIVKVSTTTGKHRAPIIEDPNPTRPDLLYIQDGITVAGKHRAPKVEVPADTVVDLPAIVIPAEIPDWVHQYDRPLTRLDAVRARAEDPDYFDKIKVMVDGLQ